MIPSIGDISANYSNTCLSCKHPAPMLIGDRNTGAIGIGGWEVTCLSRYRELDIRILNECFDSVMVLPNRLDALVTRRFRRCNHSAWRVSGLAKYGFGLTSMPYFLSFQQSISIAL